jgi:hypothetical protein
MFWILACAPEEADTAVSPPDVPPSTCGDTYTFLPTTTMGEVVDSEYVEEWSLDVDTLRSVVALGGIGDTSVIQHGVHAWRIRYRTQDRGREVEATALVAVPDTAVDAPSVLYLHPTTGFEDFCAPSGRDLTWAGVPLAFAGMGYAVVAPDYLGQNGFGPEADFLHPYLGAEPTAIASLDALRALWRFSEVDAPSRRTLLLGASQGGGGTLWAQRYASAYLPEAELIGNMMSVPVLDLVGMAEQAAAELSVASVGEPFILYALAEWYGLDLDITEVIPPDQLARVEEAIATDCPSAEVPADITSLDQVYTQAWMDALATGDLSAWDPWSCLLADSSVGSAPVGHTVDVPIFAIFGGADDVSLGDVQAAAADTLCAEGEQVVAWQCEGLGHTDTVVATADAQVAWMAARAAGEPFTDACAGVEVRSCE